MQKSFISFITIHPLVITAMFFYGSELYFPLQCNERVVLDALCIATLKHSNLEVPLHL